MTSFTSTEWREGQCWWMRFLETRDGKREVPACPRAGIYGCPSNAGSVDRQFRWCAEHRIALDVLIDSKLS